MVEGKPVSDRTYTLKSTDILRDVNLKSRGSKHLEHFSPERYCVKDQRAE